MYVQVERSKKNKNRTVVNSVAQRERNGIRQFLCVGDGAKGEGAHRHSVQCMRPIVKTAGQIARNRLNQFPLLMGPPRFPLLEEAPRPPLLVGPPQPPLLPEPLQVPLLVGPPRFELLEGAERIQHNQAPQEILEEGANAIQERQGNRPMDGILNWVANFGGDYVGDQIGGDGAMAPFEADIDELDRRRMLAEEWGLTGNAARNVIYGFLP